MGTVSMYAVVSVDGYVADENDDIGPLFDWYSNGDVAYPPDGQARVTQASADYLNPRFETIKALVVGRHSFDLTNGWNGEPPGGEHVVVVSHRPKPDGWRPDAPYHFVDGVEAAIAKAVELAGDGVVEITAGDVGGQALALGLVDEVCMDVVPVIFGSGKPYFGPVDRQNLLEDPDVVVQGERVLHLRYQVRR
jgi:dihydrofolate reductase